MSPRGGAMPPHGRHRPGAQSVAGAFSTQAANTSPIWRASTARPASIQLGFFEGEEAILTPKFHRPKTIFRESSWRSM